jgi:hypothetical protein
MHLSIRQELNWPINHSHILLCGLYSKPCLFPRNVSQVPPLKRVGSHEKAVRREAPVLSPPGFSKHMKIGRKMKDGLIELSSFMKITIA